MLSSATTHLATAGPSGSPPTLEGSPRGTRSATAWRDPFRRQRARHGRSAGFRWWHRLTAGVALLVLIGLLGVLLAALVGLGAAIGGIALEALIG